MHPFTFAPIPLGSLYDIWELRQSPFLMCNQVVGGASSLHLRFPSVSCKDVVRCTWYTYGVKVQSCAIAFTPLHLRCRASLNSKRAACGGMEKISVAVETAGYRGVRGASGEPSGMGYKVMGWRCAEEKCKGCKIVVCFRSRTEMGWNAKQRWDLLFSFSPLCIVSALPKV